MNFVELFMFTIRLVRIYHRKVEKAKQRQIGPETRADSEL